MEETVEAAATLIRYFGGAVFKPKCAELLALVPGVEGAADAAGVDHVDFTRAAAKLEEIVDEERVSAVISLGDASAALEEQARAHLKSIHSSAAKLALACSEYGEAAEALDRLRRHPKDDPQRNGRPSWCDALLALVGARGRRRNRNGDTEAGHQTEEQVAIGLNIPLLSQEIHMQEKVSLLMAQARDVFEAASGACMVCCELSSAINMLGDAADDEIKLISVVKLGTVATVMEGAASVSLDTLCDRAANPVRECGELKQAADAMATVQRAAAQQRERRASSWWSFVWRGSRQEALAVRDNPERNDWSSDCTAMQGCGLLGSLTILPYLGGTNGLLSKPVEYSYFYRGMVGSIFAWSWFAVGVGVPCIMARSPFLHKVARFCGRVGMLAMTLFVILYSYWSLFPDWTFELWILITFAVSAHIGLFIKACINRDI